MEPYADYDRPMDDFMNPEMTDEAWNEVDARMEISSRLGVPKPLAANHPSHSFTGIDGRCMNCDCRPFGRHAPHPCPCY